MGEEGEHALHNERGGILAIRGWRAVGEDVLVVGVEEWLGVLSLLEEFARGVDVDFTDKLRVGVHAVDLHGHPA